MQFPHQLDNFLPKYLRCDPHAPTPLVANPDNALLFSLFVLGRSPLTPAQRVTSRSFLETATFWSKQTKVSLERANPKQQHTTRLEVCTFATFFHHFHFALESSLDVCPTFLGGPMFNAMWPTSQSELFVYLLSYLSCRPCTLAVFFVRHVSLSQLVEVKDGLRFCLVRIREPLVPFSINFAFLVGACGRLFRLAGSVRLLRSSGRALCRLVWVTPTVGLESSPLDLDS